MNRMHAAAEANGMAGTMRAYGRVRGFRSCPLAVVWSPISLGTTADQKHGRPRWTEESP